METLWRCCSVLVFNPVLELTSSSIDHSLRITQMHLIKVTSNLCFIHANKTNLGWDQQTQHKTGTEHTCCIRLS